MFVPRRNTRTANAALTVVSSPLGAGASLWVLLDLIVTPLQEQVSPVEELRGVIESGTRQIQFSLVPGLLMWIFTGWLWFSVATRQIYLEFVVEELEEVMVNVIVAVGLKRTRRGHRSVTSSFASICDDHESRSRALAETAHNSGLFNL